MKSLSLSLYLTMSTTKKILISIVAVAALITVIIVTMPPIITYTEIDREAAEYNTDDAVMLVMAYPEAICRTTEAAYSDLLPYIGIGKKQLIRAGHACLAIIKKGSDHIEYFDNGRYIAPEGFCRVRGENTDPELHVDIKAVWDGEKLKNVQDILQWFYNHPEKTHGGGPLYAGIIENANYASAMACINKIQDQDIIEYGPFAEGGTNCARFVTDAIYNGTIDPEAREEIKDLYSFTPSGLSNIDASNSHDFYYKVTDQGVIQSDVNLSWEQINALFDGGEGYQDYSTSGTLCPPEGIPSQEGWQWLGGLGYGAWFSLNASDDGRSYIAECHNASGQLAWNARFQTTDKESWQLLASHPVDSLKITYPANYEKITVLAGGEKVFLHRIL